MNKKVILVAIFTLMAIMLMAQRVYTQKVVAADPAANLFDIVTNTSSATSPLYIVEADILETPGEILTTAAGNPDGNITVPVGSLRINRLSTVVVTSLQLANFPTPFEVGQTIQMKVIEIATGDFTTWTHVIPTGTTAITVLDPAQPVPPMPGGTPSDYTISGMFTTTSWDFTDINIVATGIDAEDIVINGANYEITVPEGWSGTVTPTKAGFIMDPVDRAYTNVTADVAGDNYIIKKDVNPDAPLITAPEPGQTFNWTEAQTVTATWTAPAGGFAPESYEVKFGEGDWTSVNQDLSWTTPALGTGDYTFEVRGVISTPQAKSYVPVVARATDRASNNSTRGNGTAALVNFQVIVTVPTYDVTPDEPVDLDENTEVEISGDDFDGAYFVEDGLAPVPNANFIATSAGILQLEGTGTVYVTFNFDPQVDWFVYNTGGDWIPIEGPWTTITIEVDLDAKNATLEFKAGTGEDPTLPVELSVFNAVFTAENFVKLNWTSESETNMLGYRVYRAESPVQAEAILITPTMIEATNTSTTQNYNHADYEVEGGNTYYYWLEAVDYSHSSFFGYRAVEVTVNTTPELPEVSAMKSAYPNPFRANSKTNIEVSVKAGESGTVTIYNVLGQVVKTYKVTEGTQIIDWNGRDNKGNACGSGIYFYKMSTPSKNITKKMVIVK